MFLHRFSRQISTNEFEGQWLPLAQLLHLFPIAFQNILPFSPHWHEQTLGSFHAAHIVEVLLTLIVHVLQLIVITFCRYLETNRQRIHISGLVGTFVQH